MPSGETTYSFPAGYDEILVRARTCTVSLRCERSGSVEALKTTTTATLYDSSGTALTPALAATITGGIAYVSISSSYLPSTLSIGPGYYLIWAPVLSGGTALPQIDRQVILCLRPLPMAVGQSDCESKYPDITTILRNSGLSSIQTFLDEAWNETLRGITERGFWPHQVKTTWSVRGPATHKALELTFRWLFRKTSEAKYLQLASFHAAQTEAAWTQLKTTLDLDDDGIADDSETLEGLRQVIHVNPAPRIQRLSSRW